MSHLVLELRPGEMMVVNGATIRFRSKCRIELVSHARFLFGKQIMAADEAGTSMRRLYYLLQTAYAGAPDEREQATRDVHAMFTQLRDEPVPETAAVLERAQTAFAAEDFYQALKLVRMILRDDRGAPDRGNGPDRRPCG